MKKQKDLFFFEGDVGEISYMVAILNSGYPSKVLEIMTRLDALRRSPVVLESSLSFSMYYDIVIYTLKENFEDFYLVLGHMVHVHGEFKKDADLKLEAWNYWLYKQNERKA